MINATLPESLFADILAGLKTCISHKRNARIDRYFLSKRPEKAKINGQIFTIARIEETPTDWVLHI